MFSVIDGWIHNHSKVSLFHQKRNAGRKWCVFRGRQIQEIPIKQTNSILAELPRCNTGQLYLRLAFWILISVTPSLVNLSGMDCLLPLTMGYQDRPCFMTDLKAQQDLLETSNDHRYLGTTGGTGYYHLCWDNLVESMNRHGFKNTTIQTQESFLLNRTNKEYKKFSPTEKQE